jgi:hypothetical protein
LPRRIPEHQVGHAQLFSQPLQRQHRRSTGHARQALGGHARLATEIRGQRVERGSAQVEAGRQRRLHTHIEPALDGAGNELVGNGVDQQARQHTHQADDGRKLDQQPAAELAAPQAQGQANHEPQQDE